MTSLSRHVRLRGGRARYVGLNLAIGSVTLFGQVVDQTPAHRAVGGLHLGFCTAVPMPHGVLCRGKRYRTTTDRDGRFEITGFKPGTYIFDGRSNEVAWFMSFRHFGPSSPARPIEIMVCSYATQSHACASPKRNRNIPL